MYLLELVEVDSSWFKLVYEDLPMKRKALSPLRTSQSNHALTASSVKAAISLAIERKKNAASWINAAAASDIPPFSDFIVPVDSTHASKRTKKSGKGSSSVEAKKKVISIKLQDKASENIPAIDKENSKCWTMGSAMSIMTSLADSLLTECRRWFLPHLEKILDEYPRKSSIKEPDREIAEMMGQIKRVNDWLDMIISKETMSMLNNDCNVRFSNEQDEQYIEIHNNVPENSIIEVCERVRSKIYKVLLEHVQKNAVRNS
ncbi:hypothetical protein Cgig2_009741 [Carnegiea gigantea]|uniref:DUF6857 domain-containing protein n=1 Tax=Carnegiea gigantea TaxID=171969 RepID=A0A9Q1JWF0_9CARY|nr:hypothetical protein Cgig2_009741 [Carnegiea gigantea]